VWKSSLTFLAVAVAAAAQTSWWGDYIPRTAYPPVVFVTGHDAICPDAKSGELPFFQLTFGDFDKILARHGRVSLVFEACYAPNRPPIEEVANVLRRLLAPLRYEGGEPVREVDIIAHSMGGLILRSYLSGKQTNGTFVPPPTTRVRKAIFIGTPHFGTHVATSTNADVHVRQMSLGSSFLFDLATWNQGTDDLRGVDSLSIAGTGGRTEPGSDSVVSLSSASIDFAFPRRTAILPLCHTQGGIGQLFLCGGTPGLARVFKEDHPTAQLVLDFLNGTGTWRTVADSATFDALFIRSSGLMVQARTANDVPMPVRSASVQHSNGASTKLNVSDAGIVFGEMLPAGPAVLDLDGVRRPIVLPAGGSRALVVKPGPWIESVEPAPGKSVPMVLSPGMRVTIRGADLAAGGRELTLGGKPVRVLSDQFDRLVAELPEGVTGPAELRLRNIAGQHSVRIMLEEAFPAFFLTDGVITAVHASTGQPVRYADPAVAGEIISIYLTGLGQTALRNGLAEAVEKPLVLIGGMPSEVLYAGRTPGSPGVDQINVRLPGALPARTGRIQVVSGARTAAAEFPVH
jgi:uncharacterized protein (TIGR03437 family)